MNNSKPENKIFGYARVSSNGQNVERQKKMLIEEGNVNERDIFIDVSTGKNFDNRRLMYKALKNMLIEGDTLVVTSIDRLGRNKKKTQKEFNEIESKGVMIKVLETPNLNSDCQDRKLAKKEMSVLSSMAEAELLNIKNRQRQGIDAMPINDEGKRVSLKTGNPIGRPKIEVPPNFDEVYYKYKNHQITCKEALELTGLKRNTFYNLVKEKDEEAI